MKKYKTITERITLDDNFFEGSLVDIRNKIQELIDKCGAEACILHEIDSDPYHYTEVYYTLSFDRPETDKERDVRLKEARKIREDIAAKTKAKEELERAEYKRLQSKYG